MLKNYFTIALRHLVRHRAFAIINVAGLAIGMACSVFIILWVNHERSYDRFFDKAGHLYRLTSSAGDYRVATSPAGFAKVLRASFPHITGSARISRPFTATFTSNGHLFEENNTLYADSSFLQLFSFRLLQGDRRTALSRPDAILLTETMARKIFGTQNPLNKVIVKDHENNLVVTGILADPPANSHLQFSCLMPMAILEKFNEDLQKNTLKNFNFYTYLEIATPPAAIPELNKHIDSLYVAHESALRVAFTLQPITDIHLQSDLQIDLPGKGNAQYVHIFSIVALIILCVACINFMNLSTARANRRAKEVGLRKMAGARRYQLIVQFLGESVLISLVAFFLALALVWALFPAFVKLSGKPIDVEWFNLQLLSQLLLVAVFTGILSGIYPALFLSAFRPAIALKGMRPSAGRQLIFRYALVIVQLVISMVLMIGTGVVYHQLQFIRNMNLGYNRQNLVYVNMSGTLYDKRDALRLELASRAATSHYTIVSELPTNQVSVSVNISWEGKDPRAQTDFAILGIDEHSTAVFGMHLLEGRSFSPDFANDDSNLVVNEMALRVMGIDRRHAVGMPLTFNGVHGRIIGVVQDFNFKPVQQPIAPLIMPHDSFGGTVVVRTTSEQMAATIEDLRLVFTRLNPGYLFSYHFVDQDFEQLYQGEQQMGRLFQVFALLAIFISCLGLYGLSAFIAEQRTKEVGIRKVLGASVWNIVYLLSGKFTRLIAIAAAMAIPLGWLVATFWLDNFAYRAQLGWEIFLIATLVTLAIAWCTISFESIKSGLANPVHTLKAE